MKFDGVTLNTIILCCFLFAFSFCSGQHKSKYEVKPEQIVSITVGVTVTAPGKNLCCVFQDNNNNIWLASNGEGVYCYDGKTLRHITEKDGLLSNFVLKIEEDINGDLWFSTRDGVCRFNGVSFVNYTDTVNTAVRGKLHNTRGGLIFGNLNGLCFYDGTSFTGFNIHPFNYYPSLTDNNRPYSVYSTLMDQLGNIWFGTQEKGVCRYDGSSFTFFTKQGLDQAAVRTLFQDKSGTIWAGNNGAGLFRFNGRDFINFSDEKGVANRDFLNKLEGKEGTLARPWTINEDNDGNIWIGTIDAGVWKYDGKNLSNYSIKDGLSGNSIWTIFKDKKGELWFVVNGEDIYKFNGKAFEKYIFG